MVKFMLKSLLLGVLLFLGILFGMQKAHDEMREMKGAGGKQTIEAPLFEKNKELEASSQSVEPEFESKTKQLQEEKSFNFFSFLGQKATALITVFFQAVISAVSFVIEELIGLLSM